MTALELSAAVHAAIDEAGLGNADKEITFVDIAGGVHAIKAVVFDQIDNCFYIVED